MTTEQMVEVRIIARRYREASVVELQAELAVSIPLRRKLEERARQLRRDADKTYDIVFPPPPRPSLGERL